MDKKLFFFDIDGTLIECEKGIDSITSSTRSSLDQLRYIGHDVFLATGRCMCFIIDGVMDYPFSGYVTCNGSYVEYKNEVIYKKVIPVDTLKFTDRYCREHHFAYYFEGRDYIYVNDKNNPKHLEFQEKWMMKPEVVKDQYDIETIETYIGMIVVNEESDVEPMIKALSPYFNVQRHQSGFSFDLTQKGESKAKGIQELVKCLNMDMKDTVAFGDGRNDIEMISTVGLGIAMGNAYEITKQSAKYVTDNVENEGITLGLKHFGFIE